MVMNSLSFVAIRIQNNKSTYDKLILASLKMVVQWGSLAQFTSRKK